ncbi:unnamed protein product [Rangifer tarandus platyrhynchus]|uniref:Uncharacterized protein n=2 Tax=Rangifer tarandus platyrhynchus TaxID=3082113 RepID=A0ABN8Z0P6_RANTA|nr:unnamed protein product [Rangifer tarandus platyrhynchus]
MCPYSREYCGHHGPPDNDQNQRLSKKRSPRETWGLTEEGQAGGAATRKWEQSLERRFPHPGENAGGRACAVLPAAGLAGQRSWSPRRSLVVTHVVAAQTVLRRTCARRSPDL